MTNDEQSLLEKQARELQQLRDWRDSVRRSFSVADETVRQLPRDSCIGVDGRLFSQMGILILFGGEVK